MDEFEVTRDGCTISVDRSRLDHDLIQEYLNERSYWASGRSKETVSQSIEHSLCFGVFTETGEQAGFARVVTDYATFAWICDLFILEPHRGKGLGKWLVETIVSHPALRSLPRQLLATRDAHDLYREYGGFDLLKDPDRWMERVVDLR
jgi:GNAT superfamily N-acetyltransferase